MKLNYYYIMSFALNEDNALIIFEFINFVKLQNSFLPNLYMLFYCKKVLFDCARKHKTILKKSFLQFVLITY